MSHSALFAAGTNFTFITSFRILIQAPEGVHAVCKKFPKLKLVTSEIDATLNENLDVIPGMGEFADRYFGTDAKVTVSHNQGNTPS